MNLLSSVDSKKLKLLKINFKARNQKHKHICENINIINYPNITICYQKLPFPSLSEIKCSQSENKAQYMSTHPENHISKL